MGGFLFSKMLKLKMLLPLYFGIPFILNISMDATFLEVFYYCLYEVHHI